MRRGPGLGLALVAALLALKLRGVGTAGAEPSPEELIEVQKARLAAEKAERAGRHAECAEAYLGLARRVPEVDPRQTAELLYNGGVCAEMAGQSGLALTLLGEIIDKQTTSPLRPRALLRKGMLLERLGRWADAAADYLRYVRQYAAEKDGYDASVRAIQILLALGDRAAARTAIDLFTKLFGAKKRGELADLQLALLEGANDAERITLLTKFLKQLATAASRDRLAVAEAELGLALWRSACARPSPEGSCTAPRKQPVQTVCGRQLAGPVATARKPAVVKEALLHLERAQQLIAAALPGTQDEARVATLKRTQGWVLLARADALLEPVRIAVGGGKGAPGPAPKVTGGGAAAGEYARWIQALQKATQPAIELYLRVGAETQGEARAAAAYRIAQSFAMLDEAIAQAAPPKALGPEGERAFCEAIDQFQQPLQTKTLDALEVCVRVARELRSVAWFDRCSAELSALDPGKWPVPELMVPPPAVRPLELPEPRNGAPPP
ncbi:MAG: hypothetical protein IT370_31675 [Deltaproteobacteria bacterium]|nr:hypothetical protein [Deltaproteobacteria bacterium]